MIIIWVLGQHLKNAIKKYGIQNFKKEIIAKCKSFKEMNDLEHQIVNEHFIKNSNTYNHAIGGSYGWLNCLKFKTNVEKQQIKQNAINALKKIYQNQNLLKEQIEKIKNGQKRNLLYDHKTFLGKHHTEETKLKMSISQKGKQCGNKNSQYGKCWIYNEQLKISKSIKKDELQKWINEGWMKGRKYI